LIDIRRRESGGANEPATRSGLRRPPETVIRRRELGRERPGKRAFAPDRLRVVREADLSDAFQDRENTFEKQFAHDEDLHFKAVARRNKALALWVAEMKKLAQADAEKYAAAFVAAQVGKSDDDVAAALKTDLAHGDIDLSDHRLRNKMDEEMAEATASVRAGK
jgi:hypothetical protein